MFEFVPNLMQLPNEHTGSQRTVSQTEVSALDITVLR